MTKDVLPLMIERESGNIMAGTIDFTMETAKETAPSGIKSRGISGRGEHRFPPRMPLPD